LELRSCLSKAWRKTEAERECVYPYSREGGGGKKRVRRCLIRRSYDHVSAEKRKGSLPETELEKGEVGGGVPPTHFALEKRARNPRSGECGAGRVRGSKGAGS